MRTVLIHHKVGVPVLCDNRMLARNHRVTQNNILAGRAPN